MSHKKQHTNLLSMYVCQISCISHLSSVLKLFASHFLQYLTDKVKRCSVEADIDELSALAGVGGLSAGELTLIDQQSADDEDILLSLRYFQSADEFVTSYVYPSVWLVQPLFSDNDAATDWALTDRWLPFLRVVQLADIFTCQINCTASYKYDLSSVCVYFAVALTPGVQAV